MGSKHCKMQDQIIQTGLQTTTNICGEGDLYLYELHSVEKRVNITMLLKWLDVRGMYTEYKTYHRFIYRVSFHGIVTMCHSCQDMSATFRTHKGSSSRIPGCKVYGRLLLEISLSPVQYSVVVFSVVLSPAAENHDQITWSTTASGHNSAVADHALQAVTALPAVILHSKSCAPRFISVRREDFKRRLVYSFKMLP